MPEYIEKLVEYFKRNLKKGYTEESLKWALVNQGYSRSIVERAIEEAHRQLSERAPVLKERPKITYQLYDQDNKPIKVKKPWWKKMFG